MTIVTTSRKPVPELRSLAKDVAFAAGYRYLTRGKTGLSDLELIDPEVIFLSKQGGHFFLRIVHHGRTCVVCSIVSCRIEKRSGPLVPGFCTGDQTIYQRLGLYIPIKLSEEKGGFFVFDGAQSRRYLLQLIIHET